MTKKITLIGLLALYGSYVNAEEYTSSLLDLSWEELAQVKVLIATGTEHEIRSAPATVTVISADDIKKTGATNLTDILETVPGVHIKPSHFGNRPLVHIRGSNSFQTLLMINGNPMRDLVWAFGIFWKGIPVSAIDRIEVIRGPGSALYGADASAGVINVITKTAGKIKQDEIGLRVGSFDSQAVWLQTGGTWQDYELGLTAEFSTTDGHDPYIKSDASSLAGEAQYGYDNQDIRFSVSKGHWQLLANLMKHDNLQTGMTGYGNFDPVTSADDKRIDLDLIYDNKNLTNNWGLQAKVHYQDLDYSSGNGFQESPPSTSYPDGQINYMSSSEQQFSFELAGLYMGIKDHHIRIGAGYDWQDLYEVKQQVNFGTGPDGNPINPGDPLVDISDTPYAFAPEKTRKIKHFFIQDVWSFAKDWELTLGVRYDDYNDFGDTINPRMALTWNTTDKLTTKLLYGQGFRAPSYQELYANTSISNPNPDLDPEESETIELSINYAPRDNLILGVNLFNFVVSDIIRKDSNRQFQNTGRLKTLGVETEITWHITDKFHFSGNYTYRNPDDNDYREVQEPEQDAYLRIDWKVLTDLNWNIQSNWIADRKRADNDPRDNIDDYIITDTTLRYSGLKQWDFAVSIRNLFDENAREHTGKSIADDLPLAERNIYAELRYQF